MGHAGETMLQNFVERTIGAFSEGRSAGELVVPKAIAVDQSIMENDAKRFLVRRQLYVTTFAHNKLSISALMDAAATNALWGHQRMAVGVL